jgi:hypothetical protein
MKFLRKSIRLKSMRASQCCFKTILTFLLLGFTSQSYGTARVGVGYSTVTSGRQIPALELGIDFPNKWAVSAMLAGARTKAYYTSGFTLNALHVRDWGKFWFGNLDVGFGGGVFYGEKGVYTEVDESGALSNLQKNRDYGVGPAFRVAFKPIKNMHISLEYMMGIGSSIISNAWQDVGMGAIGVDL